MSNKVDFMLVKEFFKMLIRNNSESKTFGICPGSIRKYNVNISTVSDRLVSFLVCTHCLTFEFVDEAVVGNSDNQCHNWKIVFRLHKLPRMAGVEYVVHAVGIDSAGGTRERLFFRDSLVGRIAVTVIFGIEKLCWTNYLVFY